MSRQVGRVVDLLVVGAGTAGLVAARTGAALGGRVLVAERDRFGGECLWTGCVPSKALLAAAAQGRPFDAALAHLRAAVAAIEPEDSPDTLRTVGVQVHRATVTFTGPDTAQVGPEPVRFRRAVLATGSSPHQPSIPGLAGLGGGAVLTTDTVWDLATLPPRLLVLGGGRAGCELAQAFARFGSHVTVVERTGRLLPDVDADAARVVTAALVADGVTVRTGRTVEQVTGAGDTGGVTRLDDGSEVPFDRLLLATGRRPRSSGLGLAGAGVERGADGRVTVDHRLATSNPRVFAAGDVTGPPFATHLAGLQGGNAAANALLGTRRADPRAGVVRVTFTDPEVGEVGARVDGAGGLRTVTVPDTAVDRAVTDGRTDGFTRLVLDGKQRVHGATVVSPRAGEVVAELALAVHVRAGLSDLAATPHPYPTWSYGLWQAALDAQQETLRRPLVHRALRAWVRVRGAWTDHGRG